MTGYDAVVLAGGSARRLGGAAKPALRVAGVALIDRVAAAVHGAGRLIVVGPAEYAPSGALVVRERPPGGGPVPALRAALPEVRAPRTLLLAADLPFLTGRTVMALLAALDAPPAGGGRPAAGAVLVDDAGRRQWLAGVWRTEALRGAVRGHRGGSLHGLLGPLAPAAVRPATGAAPAPWLDCDTAADLDAARRLASGGRRRPHGRARAGDRSRADGPARSDGRVDGRADGRDLSDSGAPRVGEFRADR